MILVIDIGTSSVRGMVVDHEGITRQMLKRPYSVQVLDDETAVQAPETIWKSILDILEILGEQLFSQNIVIEAISVTGQRSSLIPVTREGKALKKAISWQDRRSACICGEFREQCREIYSVTGMKLSTVFSAPKMMYLKQTDREVYDRAEKLIGFQEYILYHLTHEFVSDTSIASRTSLFDIRKLQWAEELLDLFGVSKAKLCPLTEVGSIVGYAVQEIQKLLRTRTPIPVVSAGGDQQCAALGMGCIKQGDLEINSGTGAYAIGLSDRPLFHPDMSVSCNVSAIPGKWIVEGAVLGAGKSVDWLVKEFFNDGKDMDYRAFTQACSMVLPGANGVVISPSFAGKGTPQWNPNIRAGIFNLSFANQKEDIARALLEGIAAELWDCVCSVEALIGTDCESVKAGGGLLKNAAYCQILSDMFGKIIEQPDMPEATGIGAWISAEVALGNYSSHEKAYQQHARSVEKKCWIPNPEVTAQYHRVNLLRKRYEKIYLDKDEIWT